MDTIAGTWDVRLRTPIGSIDAVYTFTEEADGALAGTAATRGEQVPLREITVRAGANGHRVTWRQSVTTPMRLNLDFDVLASGGELSGHSRAGRLPRTEVTGLRRRA